MSMRSLTLPVLLLAAACAPTPRQTARVAADAANTRAKLDSALAGLTPGKPMTCISQFQSQQVQAYGPTLLYRVSRGLIYRSDTAGGCERAGATDILVTRTNNGQLCRGDIGQTVDRSSGLLTGGCGFGAFVPYRKP